MMSLTNVELLRASLERFNEEGIDAIIDLFAEDFQGEVPPELSAEPDTYRGQEGARRWFAGFEGFMDHVRLEPGELDEPEPGVVVGEIRLRARGIESGIEVDQETGQIFRLRDGQVTQIEVFATVEEARAAALQVH